MKNKNKQKGITLVALVITIIILLILAGISISALTGSGLFEKTKLAKEKSENAQNKEDGILKDYSNEIDKYIDGERNFQNDSTIIRDFTLTTSSELGDVINIKVNLEDSQDIRGYIYIVNDEVKKVTEDKNIQVSELIPSTTYKVKVIAIDKYGKTRTSQEVEQKTLNEINVFKDGKTHSRYSLTPYCPNSTSTYVGLIENRYALQASYSGNYGVLYTTNPIDFSNVKSVKVNVAIRTDGGGITSTFTTGLQNEITQDITYDENLSVSKSTTSTVEENYEIILDTSSVSGNKYLKFNVHHSLENNYTAMAYITSITLIYK